MELSRRDTSNPSRSRSWKSSPQMRVTERVGEKPTWLTSKGGGLRQVLMEHRFLSSLLICIPFGFVSKLGGWPDALVFTCNFFSILPMAWLIGKSTEDLGEVTSATVAGLLNATFGNVVEMLLCIAGIRLNQLAVVKCTLVGSILSNLLLVMGTSFIVGGLRFKTQRFSRMGAGAQSSLMILAVLGITLPTMYSQLVPGEQAILDISRGCSVLLFFVYIQYLFFQLLTHKELFEAEEIGEKEEQKPLTEGEDTPAAQSLRDQEDGEDGSEEEEAVMSPATGAVVLATCTVLTTFCSEYLIDSIEETIEAWHVSKEFIGIVVLPIIGNAAEHYTAILVAYKDEMDLSLGVAVGSSCQMALLVTPFTVLVGWYLNRPMSLDFHPFQATVLLLAVLIVSNVLQDGVSHWLEGSMLCTAYIAIAIIYYCEDFSVSSGEEMA